MYRGYLTRTDADAEHLLAVRAEQRQRRQQRANRRRRSRWGWLTDPENVGVVVAAALLAWVLSQVG